MEDERKEIMELVRLGQKFKWAKGETRRYLERAGVNLVRTDFYSEAPSLDEIDASFEFLQDGNAVYANSTVFDATRIIETAEALIDAAATFDAPIKAERGYCWQNSQFSSLDALAYYGFLMLRKPRHVIEIGSGFSTHIAHRALTEIGSGELICIDPDPRTEITDLPGIVFKKTPIQEIDLSWLFSILSPGDVLFYDGSHTIKTGSDAVYFYLKILPYLPSDVLIHAHDVLLPYPRTKKGMIESKIYWSEQYILMAHLLNTARYRTLYGTNLLIQEYSALADRLMRGRFPLYGGSLWYEIL